MRFAVDNYCRDVAAVHAAAAGDADAAAVDALEMRDAESGRAPPPDGDDDGDANADASADVLALPAAGVAGGNAAAAADGVADIDASAAA